MLLTRVSPLSVRTCQTAGENVFQQLGRRRKQRVPASSRQQSTTAVETGQASVTSSSGASVSSDNSPIPVHLQMAGRRIPKGVELLDPPQNILPRKPIAPPYPCPHLSDEEVTKYLVPLYERNWGIFSRLPSNGKPATLMLAKDIKFVWHYPIVDLVNQLHIITKQENVCSPFF